MALSISKISSIANHLKKTKTLQNLSIFVSNYICEMYGNIKNILIITLLTKPNSISVVFIGFG